MKKYIAAFLCIAMCLALMSACGTETKPEESTEPITSEQPSEAPEDSAEPENPEDSAEPEAPEDSSEPETSSPLADAITSARGDEENEAYPVQSDKDAIESMYYDVLGFTADDVTELAMSVSLINVKAYGIVIAKPASASQYVEADRIQPILALSTERYTGNLADAPTLSEVGDYEDVEVPVWRGVVGPANMSEAAADYWSDVLGQVGESEQWVNNYLTPNMLISNYMDRETATEYMQQYQADYLASIGKDA